MTDTRSKITYVERGGYDEGIKRSSTLNIFHTYYSCTLRWTDLKKTTTLVRDKKKMMDIESQ